MKSNPMKLKTDMSPEAVDRRLRRLGQLYRLGKSLQKARRKGKLSELRGSEQGTPQSEQDSQLN